MTYRWVDGDADHADAVNRARVEADADKGVAWIVCIGVVVGILWLLLDDLLARCGWIGLLYNCWVSR